MIRSSRVVFLLFAAVCVGVAWADNEKDPEVEKAGVAILNAAGDFIDAVQSVKIDDAPSQGANGETGRAGKKLMAMTIPLILGFKLTGIVVAALTALKILVLKTALMSSVAFIVSVFLAGKSLWEKIKLKKALATTPYSYPGAHADMGWDANSPAGYEIQALQAGAGHHDLSHLGSDTMTAYAAYNNAAAPSAAVAVHNETAYGFMPVAERKHARPSQLAYRSTLYKTTRRQVA